MFKYSQSLIDFLGLFPFVSDAASIRENFVSEKEAKALLQIWDGERDEYGNVIVPNNADSIQVAQLTTKGLIKSKPSGRIATYSDSKKVEITDKGKEVIKKMVLEGEKSAFDKNNNMDNLFGTPTKKASSWISRIKHG